MCSVLYQLYILWKATKVLFMISQVRGILNKLTPEKFDKLSDDLLQTELNSSVILKGVIILVWKQTVQ